MNKLTVAWLVVVVFNKYSWWSAQVFHDDLDVAVMCCVAIIGIGVMNDWLMGFSAKLMNESQMDSQCVVLVRRSLVAINSIWILCLLKLVKIFELSTLFHDLANHYILVVCGLDSIWTSSIEFSFKLFDLTGYVNFSVPKLIPQYICYCSSFVKQIFYIWLPKWMFSHLLLCVIVCLNFE